jgi:hypothetical protein
MGKWGYCKPCHRLILLGEDGLIPEHGRALSSSACMGSNQSPWQDIPQELTAEQEMKAYGSENPRGTA